MTNVPHQIPRLLSLTLLPWLLVACAATGPRDAPEAALAPPSQLDNPGKALASRIGAEFARQDGREADVALELAASARLSDRPELARTALRAAMRARNDAVSTEMLSRWRALAPDDKLVDAYAAAMALGKGKTSDATALITPRQDDPKLPTDMVEALRWLPDLDRILPFLSTLADLSPTAAAAITYSRFADTAKAPEFARDILDSAIERAPEDAILRAYRARLVQESNPELARADLQQAVLLKPDSRELRLSLAAVEDLQGRTDLAARVLEAFPGKDEDVIGVQLAYAAKSEDPALITSACKRLAGLDKPHPSQRLQLLGTCAELAEDAAEAIRVYRQIGKDDAEFVEAQMRIAAVQVQGAQFADSQKTLEQLREAGTLNREELVRTYLLESESAATANDDKLALDALNRGLDALPDDQDLLYARSLRHENVGDIKGAEADLRRLIEIDPENADALNALGYTLADNTKRYQEALSLIEQAMVLKPDDAAILDSMGWVKFHMGELDEAISLLKAAYEKQAEAEIAAHLGEALWQAGREDEARLVWEEAKAQQPEDPALINTLKRYGL
ncbi:tetratricopeptide repeat protein [Ahniella affigens]|nr:tetratricopeptide repeat protein [Ahniella affigens]